ncbi:DUF3114 domain-containing protein [Periweissella fabalis]|uniref:DUF3114 domain-containing protein n=2 Tax=Periweissella fabalis TaxID=1070421 RepID=A0A7X6S2A2_9LACO|nr:DUF3114 domain-containing protein [Periweissella fabalis]
MIKMGWLSKWHQYHSVGIIQTKDISDQEWYNLMQAVKRLINIGWDQAAIKVYCRYIKQGKKYAITPEKKRQQQVLIDAMTYLIGSPVYTKMFQTSNLSAKEKLQLMLAQLQAYRDEFDFLQLTGPYKIDPCLTPTSYFLTILRKTIQHAFPKYSLDIYTKGAPYLTISNETRELAYQIHAFRSYLDRQCIEFIRHQNGENDYEKLRAYVHALGVGLDYRTGANYHNRYHQEFTFPKNMKVQVSQHTKMVEFIVDLHTGKFISEWNVYRILSNGKIDSNPDHYTLAELEQVANTESFNYGQPQHRSHRLLDIDHPKDPQIRRKATSFWRYEKDYNRGGQYVDIVNNGGHKDFLAWQKIPIASRQSTYQDYLHECRQLELQREYGFNRFYLNSNENI